MLPGLSRFCGALLLVFALIGNLGPPFGAMTPAQRERDAARAELTALLGPALAFCLPTAVDDGSGQPLRHGMAECILCCLPSPLRLAVLAQIPLLAVPEPAAVQAPWPSRVADWHEADPPPTPYRPRDPPSFV